MVTTKKYFVHDSSYIDEDVKIGRNTKIWHFSHVQSGAIIGNNSTLGQNVNVGNNVIIGSNVKNQNNVSIYEGVEIEDIVFSGPSMVLLIYYLLDQNFQRVSFTKKLCKKICINWSKCNLSMRKYNWKICFYWCRDSCYQKRS